MEYISYILFSKRVGFDSVETVQIHYDCDNSHMCVLVLCPKTGPWHPNSSLFALPYKLGNFIYGLLSHCL